MKVLAFGDVHLGVGDRDRLADQEGVLNQIFELAADRNVDLLLMAGDLFEGPTITPELLETFSRAFETLDGRMPLIAVSGNSRHDLAMREVNALAPLRHLRGVTVASRPGLHEVGGLTVATLPWVGRGWLAARLNGAPVDDLNAVMAEQLVEVARGLRAEIDGPAVLLGHWSVSGSALPSGLPVDQLREPVIPLADLERLGYDAIVLGHIHKPQLLSTGALSVNGDGSHVVEQPSRIFYTGSPMVLNHGEAGCDHGVWILDTEADPQLEFIPVESRRWITIDDLDEIQLTEGCQFFGVEDAIVRVRYTASREQARRINHAALTAALLDAGAHRVTIEPTVIREQRARVELPDSTEIGDLDLLELWMESQRTPEPTRAGMRVALSAVMEKIA